MTDNIANVHAKLGNLPDRLSNLLSSGPKTPFSNVLQDMASVWGKLIGNLRFDEPDDNDEEEDAAVEESPEASQKKKGRTKQIQSLTKQAAEITDKLESLFSKLLEAPAPDAVSKRDSFPTIPSPPAGGRPSLDVPPAFAAGQGMAPASPDTSILGAGAAASETKSIDVVGQFSAAADSAIKQHHAELERRESQRRLPFEDGIEPQVDAEKKGQLLSDSDTSVDLSSGQRQGTSQPAPASQSRAGFSFPSIPSSVEFLRSFGELDLRPTEPLQGLTDHLSPAEIPSQVVPGLGGNQQQHEGIGGDEQRGEHADHLIRSEPPFQRFAEGDKVPAKLPPWNSLGASREDDDAAREAIAMSPLDAKEQRALEMYRTDGVYEKINDTLRGTFTAKTETRAKIDNVVKQLDSVLAKSVTTKPLRVHRGMQLDSDEQVAAMFKEGGVFTDAGFTSTSVSKKIADEFVGHKGRPAAAITIDLPVGSNAAHIPSDRGYSEAEVLLPRGSSFKVASVEPPTAAGGPHRIRLIPVSPTEGSRISRAEGGPIPDQLQSESFKKWFGDWEGDPNAASKVIDKSGPQVVWHGSHSGDFNAFSPDMAGRTDDGYYGKGAGYFSPSREDAEGYGPARPFYLNLRNPFVIPASGEMDHDSLFDLRDKLADLEGGPKHLRTNREIPEGYELQQREVENRYYNSRNPNDKRTLARHFVAPKPELYGTEREIYGDESHSPLAAIVGFNDKQSGRDIPNAGWASGLLRESIDRDKFHELLERNNYDGVAVQDPDEDAPHEYLAFRSQQIKSATGNRTFDPADPNIGHAAGGEVRQHFAIGDAVRSIFGGRPKLAPADEPITLEQLQSLSSTEGVSRGTAKQYGRLLEELQQKAGPKEMQRILGYLPKNAKLEGAGGNAFVLRTAEGRVRRVGIAGTDAPLPQTPGTARNFGRAKVGDFTIDETEYAPSLHDTGVSGDEAKGRIEKLRESLGGQGYRMVPGEDRPDNIGTAGGRDVVIDPGAVERIPLLSRLMGKRMAEGGKVVPDKPPTLSKTTTDLLEIGSLQAADMLLDAKSSGRRGKIPDQPTLSQTKGALTESGSLQAADMLHTRSPFATRSKPTKASINEAVTESVESENWQAVDMALDPYPGKGRSKKLALGGSVELPHGDLNSVATAHLGGAQQIPEEIPWPVVGKHATESAQEGVPDDGDAALAVGGSIDSSSVGLHDSNHNPLASQDNSRTAFGDGGFTVPGTGSTDSVPADLPEGGFVLKKDSAEKAGYGNLQALQQSASARGKPADSQQRKVPALVMPGEVFFPPEAVDSIGLQKLQRLNTTGDFGDAIPQHLETGGSLLGKRAGKVVGGGFSLPSFLGTPSPTPQLPEDLAGIFDLDYMSKSPGYVQGKVANKLAKSGVSVTEADRKGRLAAKFVDQFSMRPPAVYERVLRNIAERAETKGESLDDDKARAAARGAAERAGPYQQRLAEHLKSQPAFRRKKMAEGDEVTPENLYGSGNEQAADELAEDSPLPSIPETTASFASAGNQQAVDMLPDAPPEAIPAPSSLPSLSYEDLHESGNLQGMDELPDAGEAQMPAAIPAVASPQSQGDTPATTIPEATAPPQTPAAIPDAPASDVRPDLAAMSYEELTLKMQEMSARSFEARTAAERSVAAEERRPYQDAWTAKVQERARHRQAGPPLLLSHRWTERTHTAIDSGFLTTRTILGKTKFRADLLRKAKIAPDMFRKELFHPCPTNFYRESVDVEAAPDGTGINYIITDKERANNLGSVLSQIGVTKIEALETETESRGSVLNGGSFTDITPSAAGRLVGIATLGMVNPTFGGNNESLPRVHKHIAIRIWGDKRISTYALEAIALRIAHERIPPGNTANTTELFITRALHERFVELMWSSQTGSNAFSRIANVVIGNTNRKDISAMPFSQLPNEFPVFLDQVVLGGLFPVGGPIGNVVFTNTDTPGVPLPNIDDQSRGVEFEMAVAQALQETCKLPRHPQNVKTLDMPKGASGIKTLEEFNEGPI